MNATALAQAPSPTTDAPKKNALEVRNLDFFYGKFKASKA
jgi:hypothetical protein